MDGLASDTVYTFNVVAFQMGTARSNLYAKADVTTLPEPVPGTCVSASVRLVGWWQCLGVGASCRCSWETCELVSNDRSILCSSSSPSSFLFLLSPLPFVPDDQQSSSGGISTSLFMSIGIPIFVVVLGTLVFLFVRNRQMSKELEVEVGQ